MMSLVAHKKNTYNARAGFTLMELLVYMGIVGIVVVIAGEAFSNSTKFRIRTDNMVKATQDAENAGMLFQGDIAQMGTKSATESGFAAAGAAYGTRFGTAHNMVYMDPDNGDYSSYDVVTGESNTSNVTFRRISYDNLGQYERTEEINWYVSEKKLMRTCKVIEKKAGYVVPIGDPCSDGLNSEPIPTEMVSGVEEFTVIPGMPNTTVDEIKVFPSSGETFRLVSRPTDDNFVSLKTANNLGETNQGGTSAKLFQFYTNYDNTTQDIREAGAIRRNQVFAIKDETTAETNWKSLCSNYGRMTLSDSFEYEISFNVAYPGTTDLNSQLFVPGVDHMTVGFRDIATGNIPNKPVNNVNVTAVQDFFFFPPVDAKGAGKRVMRFRPTYTVNNACLAFTFACYSPLVSKGAITIQNLKVNKIASSSYSFKEGNIALADKENVKAVNLKLTVKKGGETGHVDLIISTPSNGRGD
ncbi:type II secretion system protein [Fibrobacter sp.]|uniref:type II secretion system protein n=1 Tax=Fibrobacter sp. TaxID=35828 RepID=UPI003890C0F8